MQLTVQDLYGTIGRLQAENDALRREISRLQQQQAVLSGIAGDMHRKLEELDPEAAKGFAVAPGQDGKPGRG